MAGKRPAIQFYTGDWLKDPALRMCAPATRGIWMDILCCMHEQGGGQIEGTLTQLSRMLGVTIEEVCGALNELGETGAADISVRDMSRKCPELSRECPDRITIINRRMSRESKSREYERLRKQKQRCPKDVPPPVPKMSRPHSSSSYSVPKGTDGEGPSSRDVIWSLGVGVLVQSGASESSARSFLGKHAKHDESRLAEVIGYLAANPKIEPRAYIERAMQPQPRKVAI